MSAAVPSTMPVSPDPSRGSVPGGYRTWSSERLPESEQFGFWSGSVHEVFGPLRMSRVEPGGFRMKLVRTRLGALSLLSLRAQAHRADRDQSMADQDASGLVYVSVPRAGALVGRQFARSLTVDAGWVRMLAGHQPASVLAASEFRQYVIGLPAEQVVPRMADPFTAGVVRGVLPALLARRTAHLFSRAPGFTRDEATLLAGQLRDLVIASFGASGSGAHPASRIVLQAAMDEAMRRLGDRTLSVEDLACRTNVSRRTLEKLFAERGTTVHGWILERRLDRAREDLASAESADTAVEVIAHRWGFADRTHFSRVFRERFDSSPAQYRRSQRMPADSLPD